MAKFDPSGPLPNPSNLQAVYRRSDCNGAYYALDRHYRGAPQRDGSASWTQFTKLPVKTLNRKLTGGLAAAWLNILTQAQRDAWEALAPSATWTNYDGTPGQKNGWSVFMAMNRYRRYSLFLPSFNGANLFTPTETINGYAVLSPQANPPASWAQPPTPVILTLQVFGGNDAFLTLQLPPNPFDLLMETVQAIPISRTCPTDPRHYIATYNATNPGATEYMVDIYFDYPRPSGTSRPRPLLGMRYTNFITGQFSEPRWF